MCADCSRLAGWVPFNAQVGDPFVEVNAAPRRRAIPLVVADELLGPALRELVSLARCERDVQQLEARGGDLCIAAPAQQAAATKAEEDLIEGGDS
jgi:hypothetical protein